MHMWMSIFKLSGPTINYDIDMLTVFHAKYGHIGMKYSYT